MKKCMFFFLLLLPAAEIFSQIPTGGNLLWLKADAGTYTDAGISPAVNGQSVQQWNDQSGNGNHAIQLSAGLKPVLTTNLLNGMPALHFNGSMLVTPNIDLSTTDKADVYVVYQSPDPNANWQCVLEQSPDYNLNPGFNFFDNPQSVGYSGMFTGTSGGAFNSYSYPVKADWFKIVNAGYDKSLSGGQESFLRVNGKDINVQYGYLTGNGTGNFSNLPFYIGNRGSGLAYPLRGDIAEIIVYNRKLTLPEKQQIETYLQGKYSINCNTQVNSISKPGSGNALIFPGSGSYGAIAGDDDDWYWGTGDFALEAWINPTGGGQDNCIMTQSVGSAATPGSSSFYWSFNYGSANSMAMAFYTTTGISWNNVIYTAPGALTAGKWQHIAVTRSAGVTKLYVNGIQQATTGTVAPDLQNASQPLGFGIQNGTPYLGGWLDEIRIYKGAAPSQSTLRDWMCRKTTAAHPNYANMVALYHFDEDLSKGYALDAINCHDAYLIGSTVHVLSGAALGDVSAHDYTTNTGQATLSFGTPADNITVTMNAGTSAGVQVYGIQELPNNQNYPGLSGNPKYAGVYIVNGNASAAGTLVYNYSSNPAVTASNEPQLKLMTRSGNTAGSWSVAPAQTQNTGAKTITTGTPGGEYVLAALQTPVPPVCYASFPNAGDLFNRTDQASTVSLLDSTLNNFTYEVWANPTQPLGPGSTSGDRYLIWPEQAASVGKSGYGIGIAAGTNGIRVYAHTSGQLNSFLAYSGTINSWTHIAVTCSPDNQAILYVNGIAVASTTYSGQVRAENGFMYIDTYGHYYGQAAGFRLWKYARSGTEIMNGMNSEPANNAPGLLVSYPLNNVYNGSGQLIRNTCTNTANLILDYITAGSATTPSFSCNGQTMPVLTQPSCGIQFNGSNKVTSTGIGAMPAKGTVEFWIKPRSFSNYQAPLALFDVPANGNNGMYFTINSSGQIFGLIGNGNTTYTAPIFATLALNTPAHIAMSWDTLARVIRYYVNGKITAEVNNPYWPTVLNTLYAGTGRVIGTDFFNGDMDEIRFWNTERSQLQIIRSASDTLTGNEPGLLAYYNFNDNTLGGNGQTVLNISAAGGAALNGITSSTNAYPRFPCAFNTPLCGITTNGSTDRVDIPYQSVLGLTQFTIAGWVKTSSAAVYQTILCKQNDISNPDYVLHVHNGKAEIIFQHSPVSAGSAQVVTGNSLIIDGQWHFIAGTYDGSSLKIYVDGVHENTLSSAFTPVSSSQPMAIGAWPGGLNPLNGSLDEVSLWNTALTPAQIFTIMNQPPAGNESGLIASYSFNDNNRSGAGRIVTNFCAATGNLLNGITSGSATSPLFECAPPLFTSPECNLRLNGSTDFASVPNHPSIQLTSFTAGAYFKTTISGTQKTILYKDANGSGPNYQLNVTAGNQAQISFYSTTGTTITATGTTSVTDGSWHYTVGTFDGSNLKLYVDGALQNSVSTTAVPLTGSGNLVVGATAAAQSLFSGDLDELSVWNTALPLTQIQSLIGQRLTGNESGLITYYNFAGNLCNGQNQVLFNSASASGSVLNGISSGTATTPVFTCSEIQVADPACSLLLNGNTDGVNATNGSNAITYPAITQNFTMEIIARPAMDKRSSGAGPFPIWPAGHYIQNGLAGQTYVISPDYGYSFAAGHAGVGISLGTNGIGVYEHSYDYLPGRVTYNAPIRDWTHISVVCSNGQLKLYVNGSLKNTASASGYILHPSLSISSGNLGRFGGQVSEVRVWNTALSADQIRNAVNANLTGAETGLVSLYKFSSNSSNGENQVISGSGSMAGSITYKTTGTAYTPLFSCAGTTSVRKDSLPGSGKMLSFGGNGSFAELGNWGTVPATGSITCWFNANTLKNNAVLFTTTHFRDHAGRHKGLDVLIRNNQLLLLIGTDTTASSYQDTVTILSNVDAARWYHLALTWNTASGSYQTYINGLPAAAGSSLFWPDRFESVKAGSGIVPGAVYGWDGLTDEITEWNTALTQTEIRSLMCSKLSNPLSNYANLLHYYRFDNTTGGTNLISDYAGTAHGFYYLPYIYDYWIFSNGGTFYHEQIPDHQFVDMPVSSAPLGAYSRYQYNGNISSASVYIGNAGAASTADLVTATVNTGTADGIHVYGEDVWPNTLNGVPDTVSGSHRYAGVFVVNPAGAQYNLVYDYTNNPFITPLSEPFLGLKKRNSNASAIWITPGSQSLNQTANTITCTGENTEYILEKRLVPLPLQWLAFTAKLNTSNQTMLNWKLSGEEQISHYIVEWSTDGTRYSSIASVPFTPEAGGRYQALHPQPATGINYYRIRAIGYDGTARLSTVQQVKLNAAFAFSVFPNPAHRMLFITGSSNISRLQLMDMQGHICAVWNKPGPTIALSGFSSGMYTLKALLTDGTENTERITIVH